MLLSALWQTASVTLGPSLLSRTPSACLLQVFVQQKVMEVAGMDASVVVQVFVEGTKAAVAAVSTKVAGADKAADVSEEVDAASVASALAQAGLDNSAPGAEKVAGPAGGSVSGNKRGGAWPPRGRMQWRRRGRGRRSGRGRSSEGND